MRRLLLNLLTALSLLLCVAVVVLWVRSYAWEDGYGRATGHRHYSIFSVRGLMAFSWTSRDPGWRDYRGGGRTRRRAPPAKWFRHDQVYGWYSRRMLGFGYGHDVFGTSITTGEQTAYFVAGPHWSVAAAALVAPATRSVAALRRRRRRRRGLCPSCGYDLRATQGRCPECGHEPAPVSAEGAEA